MLVGPSWLWSYGSWIYNYLCNQCPSPLKFKSCLWWGVSYVVAVGFNGGGNWRKPSTSYQTLSHNVVSSTPHHKQDLNLSGDGHYPITPNQDVNIYLTHHHYRFYRHMCNKHSKIFFSLNRIFTDQNSSVKKN
jgi:hypothetical protein